MPQNRHFDLNLLRVFVSVCQLKSITKAAESLDLTQSSVSNAIIRLKKNLGEELFIRVGRGIQPTGYALQLLEQLEGSMLNIDSVLQGGDQFDPEINQRIFNVYAMDSVIHLLQPKVDKLLKDSAVDIVFRELSGQGDLCFEDLLTDKIDLLIDVTAPTEGAFMTEKVTEASLSCIARKAHPRIQGTITREEYFAEKHAFLNMRRVNLALVDYFTDEVLPRRKMYSEHGSIMSMLTTIANSDAIGIAPTGYTQQYANLLDLQVLDLPIQSKRIDIFMVSAKKLAKNSANTWLRDTLREIFNQPMLPTVKDVHQKKSGIQ